MNKIIIKIFQILAIIIGVLGVLFYILLLSKGDAFIKENLDSSILNGYMNLAYVAFAIAVVLAIVIPLLMVFKNPKSLLSLLGVLALFVVIGLVAYFLASDSILGFPDTLTVSPKTSKLVGAGLFFTYIIGGLTILSLVYASVSKLFK